VIEEIDCQVFEDQLEELVQGTLSEEGSEQLWFHAEACADCATQLRVHQHLTEPSLADLEAAVPKHLVDSMWPRLAQDLTERANARPHSQRFFAPQTWVVPVLAAASLALLFLSGVLYGQLRQSEERGMALVQQLSDQQTLLAELAVGQSRVAGLRTALTRPSVLGGRRDWLRALSEQEAVTVAELAEMLRRVPGSTPLVGPGEVEAALASTSSLMPPAWRAVLRTLVPGEPVRAGDLLRVLETLDVRPGTRVPTSRFVQFLN
jgi:hypothetical protein